MIPVDTTKFAMKKVNDDCLMEEFYKLYGLRADNHSVFCEIVKDIDVSLIHDVMLVDKVS